MSWLTDLVTSEGTVDATKLAAWIGCVGVLWQAVKRLSVRVGGFRDRPRVRAEKFGRAPLDGTAVPIPFIALENVGRASIDLDCVRLIWRDRLGIERCWDMRPGCAEALQPKTRVNRYDVPSPSMMCYWVDDRQFQHVDELAGLLDVDVTSWRLEAYVLGRPEKPVCVLKGRKLTELSQHLRAYANEPAVVPIGD